MNITNLTAEPLGKLYSWLPHNLKAEQVIFLPDACPGKSPLPTGTAVFTKQPDWRKFAVSDCGCGMRLVKSTLKSDGLTAGLWDAVATAIKSNKGELGDLGGGNHFLDALLPYDDDQLYFLIHTGSRLESGIVDDLVDQPAKFDREFERVVDWAEANRTEIQKTLEKQVGPMELLLDLPHNTFEKVSEGVIIRKGSVKLLPGQLAILPSHMFGDVSLVSATDRIAEILFSMSHGTGRTISRSDAKDAARQYDLSELQRKVMMPTFLNAASLITEGPFAYRELDDCLALIDGYVEEIKRFSVVAYMGHL
jgi:RNA-splicing ligase RtcB